MTPYPTGLGLFSAASWGGSDFVGGLGARRAPALLVTAAGQVVSLAILILVCVAAHIALPVGREAAYTAIGGFEGALALAIFYRALSMGPMGLTAALTGLLTAIVPVVFSWLHDGAPTAIAAVGLVAGCAAIWLITHQKGPAAPPRALVAGAAAGVGFGAQLILFRLAPNTGMAGMMTLARIAGLAGLLLVLAFSRPNGPMNGFWLTGGVSGILDTAGNFFYIGATRLGRLDAAAVVCSLYPAGTILLAAIFLRERPSARQLAGMGLALGAVALLSL